MGRRAGQWQQVHDPDHYAALSAEQRVEGIVPDGRYRFPPPVTPFVETI